MNELFLMCGFVYAVSIAQCVRVHMIIARQNRVYERMWARKARSYFRSGENV